MASTPRWKLYDPEGQYQGAVKTVSLAAPIFAAYGAGWQLRDGHRRVVWTEGVDGDSSESYDAIHFHIYHDERITTPRPDEVIAKANRDEAKNAMRSGRR